MAIEKEVDPRQQSDTNKLSIHEEEFITELRGKIQVDFDDISQWRAKASINLNQRMGVKKPSNTAYEGAPNIPLPETDKLIKQQVPVLVLSTWKAKKLAKIRIKRGIFADQDLKEKARKAELALNSLLRSPEVDLYKKMYLAADMAKNYGHCLARVLEQFDTSVIHKAIDMADFGDEQIAQFKTLSREEQQQFIAQKEGLDLEDDDEKEIVSDILSQFSKGKTVIEYDLERITSFPNIEVPLPTKVVVPSYTTDINKAVRITYETFMTPHVLEDLMDNGTFRKKDLKTLPDVRKADDDIVEKNKAYNEGVVDNSLDKDLYRLKIVNTYFKPTKGAKAQRWVFVLLADIEDSDQSLLYSKPFHFGFDMWDYEKYDDEIKDPRYYNSRGIGERIRAIQEVMERSINNLLIRDEMNNTPIWEVQTNSDILDNHGAFKPGEMIPVNDLGQEINALTGASNVDVSSERVLSLMKAYAEEYIPSTDQLFGNSANSGGADTLGEIDRGMQKARVAQTVDVINWNNFWSRVYTKIFLVMQERMTEPMVVDGEVVTPADLQFQAEVTSNGDLELADNELSARKALARINVLLSPALQDIVNSEDKYNAVKDWLDKDNIQDVDAYTTDPKIMAQEKIVQLQQQLQQMMQQAQQLQDANIKATKTLARTKTADVKGKIKNIVEAEEGIKDLQEKNAG